MNGYNHYINIHDHACSKYFIYDESKKINISKCIFKNYIRTVVCLIKQNKYNQAIILYKEMTNNLKNFYNTNIETKEYNYNIKTLGKSHT